MGTTSQQQNGFATWQYSSRANTHLLTELVGADARRLIQTTAVHRCTAHCQSPDAKSLPSVKAVTSHTYPPRTPTLILSFLPALLTHLRSTQSLIDCSHSHLQHLHPATLHPSLPGRPNPSVHQHFVDAAGRKATGRLTASLAPPCLQADSVPGQGTHKQACNTRSACSGPDCVGPQVQGH